jgi:hypothetical protein
MQLCVGQFGVCKGTPVDVTGRPHPRLSTKLAIEKRRRRQISDSVDRFAVRAYSAPVHRKISFGPLVRIHTNHTIKSFPYFRDGRHTGVEFRGYLRFFP